MSKPRSLFSTPVSRRVVLRGGATVLVSAVLPVSLREAAAAPTPMPSFLDGEELRTLAALVDRIIPADSDPGALAANCARFIDAFLGAFRSDPPFIYAGGPFSDRGGNPNNDFLEFLPLDPYEETAWRLVLEGSAGKPELEFNGPVTGLQKVYREGLAALNARAQQFGVAGFADAPEPTRDVLLRDPENPAVSRLVNAAYLDTMNGMYGPPEYGGNQDFVGWTNNGYDGDTQPRGYTAEQVINADNPGPFDAMLPPSFSEGGDRNAPVRAAQQAGPIPRAQAEAIAAAFPQPAHPLPGVISQEVMSAVIADAEGDLSRLRRILKPYADSLPRGK